MMGFVNIYNDLMDDKDKSKYPTSWNNMKEIRKRLMQNEEWKAERANLEGKLFIHSKEKCETEERELFALWTKVKLQKDQQCLNENINNL